MRSDDLRRIMNLLAEDDGVTLPLPRDEDGRRAHPDIKYDVTPKKVTADVSSYVSQTFTKLAQKIVRMRVLTAEINELEAEVKQQGRNQIAEFFSAADAVRTRVIETVSFTLKLTADPAPTTTVKYAEVLKELEQDLTPELIEKLNDLKKKYSTVTQKSAALSWESKRKDESVNMNEGAWDNLKEFFKKYLNAIRSWGKSYDSKLNALKAKVEGVTESFDEPNYGRPYQSLNDFYSPGSTEIWYVKPDFFGTIRKADDIDPNEVTRTHVHVGNVAETDLEKVFEMMQGENWSPMGEARSLIRKLGLAHTSMSVGDIITVDGVRYMVAFSGFDQIDPLTAESIAESALRSEFEKFMESPEDKSPYGWKDQSHRKTWADPNRHIDDTPHLERTIKTGDGRKFYIWSKKGKFVAVDQMGKNIPLAKEPADVDEAEHLLAFAVNASSYEVMATKELALEGAIAPKF